MSRFFVKQDQITDGIIRVTGADAKHISVLRHGPGDEITLSDGAGADYECRILSVKKGEVTASVIEKTGAQTEPGIEVTLFQGLPKSDKMELIIQKAVELGAFSVVPVVTRHSVVNASVAGKKAERWQKISESAAKQSNRGVIPRIHKAVSLEEAGIMAQGFDEIYVAYESEKILTASAAFSASKARKIGIFIGPEGGFSEDEIVFLRGNGAMVFSLGRRILRTETAGFTAIIGLMLYRDEL